VLSDFPFKDEPIEIGIDEAGRGPVLGPMVYGCVFWPASRGHEMRTKYGFNDSKQVTEEMREKMFEEIKTMEVTELGWMIHASMPEDLSSVMLHVGNGQTLNTVSYNAAFGLLKHVLKLGFKVKSIICDQVGPP